MDENEVLEGESLEELVAALRSEIADAMKERRKYPRNSQEYRDITQVIADDSETIKSLEIASSEKSQGESARSNKNAWAWQLGGQVFGNIAGQVITSMINRQNVKTVVGYEQDGGIVNSKAIKYTR